MADDVMIPFTQFLLPDGRQKPATLPVSAKLARVARELIEGGHEFHAEILTTGEVSLTCFDPREEVDIAIEVCANGPEVPKAVERLILSAKEEAAIAAQ